MGPSEATSPEVENATAKLFEALELTGADTNGYDGWRHWLSMHGLSGCARQLREAARELRHDYDKACEDHD